MGTKITDPSNRIANRAYMFDGTIRYDGEALLLALLLHTTGTASRSKNDLDQVSKMLNDPNLDKPKPKRYTRKS